MLTGFKPFVYMKLGRSLPPSLCHPVCFSHFPFFLFPFLTTHHPCVASSPDAVQKGPEDPERERQTAGWELPGEPQQRASI